MYKFPSISQFRQVVRNVSHKNSYVGEDDSGEPIYDGSKPLPTLKFHGSVKLHGTNASVVLDKDGNLYPQSRNNALEFGGSNGHQGFVDFVEERKQFFLDTLGPFVSSFRADAAILYGEWAGMGIQQSVAVSLLKKMFYIFALKLVKDDDSQWVFLTLGDPDQGIHHVLNFPYFEMDIDFNKTAEFQNELIKATDAVEAECPIAKQLGVSGVGEGVVWKCVTPGWESSDYWFKVKGDKHSVTKVKKLVEVDLEKVNTVNEFIDIVATEARLSQGIEHLKEQGLELSQRSTGDFIRWMFNDVLKEEADRMEASGLTNKDLGKPLSVKTRNWYFTYLDSMI